MYYWSYEVVDFSHLFEIEIEHDKHCFIIIGWPVSRDRQIILPGADPGHSSWSAK